jgi:hypothetical protein
MLKTTENVYISFMKYSQGIHIHISIKQYNENRTRFRKHRPSVENSLVFIVVSVKYNRESEKNIENCFFHINLRSGA